MDRRRFLHMFLTAPALTPLLLAAEQATHHGGELFLISDKPEDYLPVLLAESAGFLPLAGKSFCFNSPHPQQQQLRQRLEKLGWAPAALPSRAHLRLSFSPLHSPSRPSFTFVREGRIWDVRSRKLRSLWDAMGQSSQPSASLTIAGFRPEPHPGTPGRFAAAYQDGRLRERFPLDRVESVSFPTRRGALVVRVEKGAARVVHSPCRHQICRYTPPISQAGERVVCAPSHFLLEIQGPSGLDTVIG